VKKILAIGSIGTILLLVFLWASARSKAGGGPATGSVASAQATAAAPLAAATIAAAPAGAVTPPTSDSAACARLAELCTTSEQKVDASECEKKLADGRKMSGAANVERSVSCIAEAKTCAAASGCVSGGIGMGAVGEFFKGLGSAMSK
jgi:hypothetical protein